MSERLTQLQFGIFDDGMHNYVAIGAYPPLKDERQQAAATAIARYLGEDRYRNILIKAVSAGERVPETEGAKPFSLYILKLLKGAQEAVEQQAMSHAAKLPWLMATEISGVDGRPVLTDFNTVNLQDGEGLFGDQDPNFAGNLWRAFREGEQIVLAE